MMVSRSFGLNFDRRDPGVLGEPGGTVTVIHSTTLFFGGAGTFYVGPGTPTSGRICQPSGQMTGGGCVLWSPLKTACIGSTREESNFGWLQRTIIDEMAGCWPANQGGILRSATASFIALA